MKEYEFYDSVKNWDFSSIKCDEEYLTDWDMYEIIRKNANPKTKILDLGTGGGERVLKGFPDAAEILGTDYSAVMIETANKNLQKSDKKHVEFRVMDNLAMDTPDNYYDVVVARHTVIDPEQIKKTLKPGGLLVVRGVDQLDCWELKRTFGRGQAYKDQEPISRLDYEAILSAGFTDVELVPIHAREYYKTEDDLLKLLYKTPILNDFSEKNPQASRPTIESDKFQEYVDSHRRKKGILLIRRYYGITARKPLN